MNPYSLQEDFETAKRDASARQQFLSSIDLEDAAPFVRKVVYKTDQQTLNGKPIATGIIPGFFSQLGLHRQRSLIQVWPYAFDVEFESADDLLGVLIDHEGFHASEIFEDPQTIVYPFWRKLIHPEDNVRREIFDLNISAEIRALENQLRRLDQREYSQRYKTKVREGYESCLAYLL